MRAGTLRERVTIQANVPGTDAQWGTVDESQDVATVWASVTPRSGSESLQDQGVASITSHDVVMRYRSDVTSANRLSWRGQTLEIIAVVPDSLRRQLSIECKVST